jgi:ATP-binding cassette subfamily B multidrug efflux pump
MFRFFENLVDPYKSYVPNDTPPQGLWPFLRDYVREFRGVFTVTALFSVGNGVLDVGLLWYLGHLVDLLTQSAPPEFFATHWGDLAVVAFVILVIRPLVAGGSVALLHNTILTNFGTMIRWRAHGHVLRQPVGWFESDFAGRIANRIMQAPPAAGDAVFQVFDMAVFALTTFVGACLMLFDADPRLMVPLILWALAYGALMRWTIRRAGPASTAASEARSAVTGRVVDSYTNIHSVKLFANHGQEMDYAREAIEGARVAFQKEMRIVTVMDIVLNAINGLMILGVAALALYLWYHGLANVGVVASAVALVLRLHSMTFWIMWASTNLVQNLGTVAEGLETISQPITLVDAPQAAELQFKQGLIEFQSVSHHYGRGAGGLDRLNLVIKPGEKIGLVGRSGAGKTTLVKLILRFYDTEEGRILIDGQDIAKVSQESLRRVIGMVQQESTLLHRSVRENILYANPTAGDEAMLAAAKKAESHDFILDLQDPKGRTGYDAHVGERGVKLSGGQRQRVAIARVILKDAPILIMDEATSALDSEAEALIQKALFGVMEGKTVIAIAHRLSTIAAMDRIVVLDRGHIVEEGSHSELLARGGLYASLWARQSGGFLGEDIEEEV